jgi:ferredoxin-NADP reductase
MVRMTPVSDAAWDPEVEDRLTCVAAFHETHDTKTFVFEAPGGARFVFDPGQFLTFGFEIGGELVNRCYSLASSPMRPRTASITVKRVPGGVVSEWLHTHLAPGMTVAAQGPMGAFTAAKHAAAKYLFLSGGSGITPVMSMTRAFADQNAQVDLLFVHAARTPLGFVFRTELSLLARRLPGLRLVFIPERRDGEPEWPGVVGRISSGLFRAIAEDINERTVFCCGPAPFMAAACAICTELGVPPEAYNEESFDFSTLQSQNAVAGAEVLAAEASEAVALNSFAITFTKSNRMAPGLAHQTVLTIARDIGVPIPSSCRNGVCGTCKSKLVSGAVEMNHQGGIRQREIAAGLFLPCCSKPRSDLTVER